MKVLEIFERLKICLVIFSIELESCSLDCLQERKHSVRLCLIDCIKKLGLFGSIVGVDDNWSFYILTGCKNRGDFNYRLNV